MAERKDIKRKDISGLRARFSRLEDKLEQTQARFRDTNRRGFVLDYDRFVSGLRGFSSHGRNLSKQSKDSVPNRRTER